MPMPGKVACERASPRSDCLRRKEAPNESGSGSEESHADDDETRVVGFEKERFPKQIEVEGGDDTNVRHF